MKIRLAEYSGFCFGVKRSIKLAENTLKAAKGKKVYSLGPLIHNFQEMQRLEKKGLTIVEELKQIPSGALFVVRSHGLAPSILEKVRKKKLKTVDTTCPNVKKSQELANLLFREGCKVIIIGDRRHPEVKSLKGFARGKTVVVENETEARKIRFKKKEKIGLLAQTTQSKEFFRRVVSLISQKQFSELRIFNTICNEVSLRQQAALGLCGWADLMIVVGGRMSANTKRLASICRVAGVKTRHIEKPGQLRKSWLKSIGCVGLIGGASTPEWLIRETVKKLETQ